MGLLSFFKNTYKIIGVVIFIIVFFVFYNTYLVDRSLVNLKIALERVSAATTKEDFQKIQPLLKLYLQKQISKKSVSSKDIAMIEMVENLTETIKTPEQAKDIEMFLQSIIDEIEKNRGGFRSFLDTLNSRIYSAVEKLPESHLRALEKGILSGIKTVKDKDVLQELYYDLGNIYIQLADTEKAESAFLNSIQTDPGSILAVKSKFNLAWAYKSAGKYKQAVKYFEEVGSEAKERGLATSSKFEIADSHYKNGQYQKAVEQYIELSAGGRELGIADLALYEAAYISFHNLNRKELASKYFAKLGQKFPKSKFTKHAVIQVKPGMSKNLRREGYKLLNEKKYLEATANFRQALRIAPSDARSLSGMSVSLYWLGRKREAFFRAGLAAKIAPLDELVVTNTLFIFINSGKADQAIKIGENILSKKAVTMPEFYYDLGSAYYLKKNFARSLELFKRVLGFKADSASLRNKMGCAYWSMGNYDDAIRQFKEASGKDANYAMAHFNLGLVYFSLNRLEESYSEFKNTVGIDPIFQKAVKPYLDKVSKTLKYTPQ